MKRSSILAGTIATAAAAAIVSPAGAAEAAPKRLPTYEVRSAGADGAQADRLAQALGLAAPLLEDDGALRFLDKERFGFLPSKPLPAPAPDEEGTPVIAEAPDLDAIRAIEALPGDEARRRAVRALRRARLAFGGRGVIGHSQFDSVDANGRSNAHVDVDTHVSFPRRLSDRPLIGAGEKAKVIFDAEGRPTYLRYAHRELERGGGAALLGRAAADKAAVARFATGCPGEPALTGLKLSRRVVYYAPPLGLDSVKRIVPHYDYGGTAQIGGETVDLQRVLVPAVRRGAPKVRLQTSADGGRVTAAATVKGGTAPYTYQYSSCASTLPEAGGASIAYDVSARPGGPATTQERLMVTVTDANGLTATTRADVDVPAAAAAKQRPPLARASVGGTVDVASEGIGNSGGLPNTSANTADFRAEMDDVSTIGFAFADTNVWESDFTDPGSGGNDGDYADNVDLMWFQGHGNPNGFATGDGGFVDKAEVTWGNSDLEWLVVHSCSVLELGSGATHVWNRWKPAFAGLHLLMGYGTSSYNVVGDGKEFGDDLADDDMRLREAWVDTNEDEQPAGVIYRYMGIYGPSGEWNREDFFHGIGSVSADITTENGAWSYSGTV